MTVNATSHVATKVTAKPVRDAKRTPEKKTQPRKAERNVSDPRTASDTSKKPEPAKSPQVRDQMMCKTRPQDNRPKGGKGSGKSFVPWKGTKFGCR